MGYAVIQTVNMFVDDSGVFHSNENSGYFVYAGFAFLSKEETENARRAYRKVNAGIKRELNYHDELKASMLRREHKRALYNVLRKYHSLMSLYA